MSGSAQQDKEDHFKPQMSASSAVSLSLFVLSATTVMFVSSFRRSLHISRPVVKSIATGTSPTETRIPSSGRRNASPSPVAADGSCQTKDKSACDACADKVNDMFDTVKAYDRHVIISVPSSLAWESDIERQASQFPFGLVKHISEVKKRIAEANAGGDAVPQVKPLKLKLTAMVDDNEPSNEETQKATVIVYPDNLKFTVRADQFAEFAWLVSQPLPLTSFPGELSAFPHATPEWKKLVLVCVHGARDKRCGKAGPEVIAELHRLLAERKAQEDVAIGSAVQNGRDAVKAADVAVRGSSHIGGHVYAGTMIVYPEGRWYGRINQQNSADLLSHVLEGTVFSECERGVTTSKVLQW